MNEPRKASDILVSLENQVNQLLQLVRSQDLNIKILSNKLNVLLNGGATISEEYVAVTPTIKISTENQIPMETSPKGFRRVSRPETYANTPIIPPSEPVFQDYTPPASQPTVTQVNVKIPVSQKILSEEGKALFLTDVEIINSEGKVEYKTRTNSAGTWNAVLSPGSYKVHLRKTETLSKKQINLIQNIVIDGLTPVKKLPDLIAK